MSSAEFSQPINEPSKEGSAVATTEFQFEGKSYTVPTDAAYKAKYTVLPDGTLLGFSWIESLPPTIKEVFEMGNVAMAKSL